MYTGTLSELHATRCFGSAGVQGLSAADKSMEPFLGGAPNPTITFSIFKISDQQQQEMTGNRSG